MPCDHACTNAQMRAYALNTSKHRHTHSDRHIHEDREVEGEGEGEGQKLTLLTCRGSSSAKSKSAPELTPGTVDKILMLEYYPDSFREDQISFQNKSMHIDF